MFSRAERRPARPERTPRRTRATAPAHSKPSCKGAFFLEFDSFIRQNPQKQKRDPVRRSTLRHSIGPKGTRIPPSTAVLASDSRQSAGHEPHGTTRNGFARLLAPHRPCTTETAISKSPGVVLKIAQHVFISSENSTNNFGPRHSWRLTTLTTNNRVRQMIDGFHLHPTLSRHDATRNVTAWWPFV